MDIRKRTSSSRKFAEAIIRFRWPLMLLLGFAAWFWGSDFQTSFFSWWEQAGRYNASLFLPVIRQEVLGLEYQGFGIILPAVLALVGFMVLRFKQHWQFSLMALLFSLLLVVFGVGAMGLSLEAEFGNLSRLDLSWMIVGGIGLLSGLFLPKKPFWMFLPLSAALVGWILTLVMVQSGLGLFVESTDFLKELLAQPLHLPGLILLAMLLVDMLEFTGQVSSFQKQGVPRTGAVARTVEARLGIQLKSYGIAILAVLSMVAIQQDFASPMTQVVLFMLPIALIWNAIVFPALMSVSPLRSAAKSSSGVKNNPLRR